jgi:alpha-beta hydrolase superfamily lysophospholipase
MNKLKEILYNRPYTDIMMIVLHNSYDIPWIIFANSMGGAGAPRIIIESMHEVGNIIKMETKDQYAKFKR